MKQLSMVALALCAVVSACDGGAGDGETSTNGVPWQGGADADADADVDNDGSGSAADGSTHDDGSGDTAPPSTGCLYALSGTDGCGTPPSSGGSDPGTGPGSGTNPGASPSPDPDGWDPELATMEDEVLALVNDLRSRGANCGGSTMAPVPPLSMNAALRSAARHHSQDMADNDYFDHTSLDGRSPWDRMAQAGYDGMPVGENIAAGSATAEATFQQWQNSPGHCMNMMSQNANEIGIGVAFGGSWGAYWTQTFGAR